MGLILFSQETPGMAEMAIVISKVMVQQRVIQLLENLGAEEAEDLLSLADEAYHQILSLHELLKHAIAYTPRDELELIDTLEILGHAMQQVERRFDEAVDQLCPKMVNAEPKPQPFT